MTSKSARHAPDVTPAWWARLEQLEASVRDLAQDQRRLHLELTRLIEALPAPELAQTAKSAVARPAEPQLSARWARIRQFKQAGLQLVRRFRQLWQASDPTFLPPLTFAVEPTRSSALPDLALVLPPTAAEILPRLRQQTVAAAEWIFWDRDSGRYERVRPAGESLGQGKVDATGLREISPAAYFLAVSPPLPELPTTTFELALWTLAAEELLWLELPREAGAWLFVRRALFHGELGIDPQALPRVLAKVRRPLVGKLLPRTPGLDRAWLSRPQQSSGLRQLGPYVLVDRPYGQLVHRIHSPALPSPPTLAADTRPAVLLLAASWSNGSARLAADLVREFAATHRFLVVTRAEEFPDERQNQLEKLGATTYALTFFPLSLHLPTVLALIDRERVRTVLTLSAGAADELQAALGPTRSAVSVVDLPALVLAAAAPPGLAEPPAAAPERLARLRQELGVPATALLVTLAADLVPEQRPEDFLALARRLAGQPDLFFLLLGRGPLEGTVCDLAAYFRLPNFRHIRAADLDEVVVASDIVCSTAERDPWPLTLLAALAGARPVIVCADPMAQLITVHGGGLTVPVADLAGLEQAVLQLTDPEQRQVLGRQGAELARRQLGRAPFVTRFRALLG